MNSTKKILSKKIFLAISLVYILNYFMDNRLGMLLQLDPEQISNHLELWRLFTFPLAYSNIESILIGFFAFIIISPKLEEQLHNPFYSILLFLVVFLQGIICTLVFLKSKIIIAGLDGVSFFIITFFSFLNKKYHIRLSGILRIKLFWVTLFISFVWFSIKLSSFQLTNSYLILFQSSSAIFGLITGSLAFLQIYLLQKMINRNKKQNNVLIPKPEELSLSLISKTKLSKMNSNLIDEYDEMSFHSDELNEDKLNEILDKISEFGKDSLTIDEIKFLDEYSKHI